MLLNFLVRIYQYSKSFFPIDVANISILELPIIFIHIGRTAVIETQFARANFPISNKKSMSAKGLHDRTCKEITVWSVRLMRSREFTKIMIELGPFPKVDTCKDFNTEKSEKSFALLDWINGNDKSLSNKDASKIINDYKKAWI